MTEMILNTPPQVEEAYTVVAKLETLGVGESVTFVPPIQPLTTPVLYLLLREIDKGWKITAAPPPKRGWWKKFKNSLNAPCDFGGRLIPQSISEIQRIR